MKEEFKTMTKPESKSKRSRRSPVIQPATSKAIVAMRKEGLSYEEIAIETGYSKAGIWQHLKRIDPKNKEFQHIKQNLADQLLVTTIDNINLSAKYTKYLEKLSAKELKLINPVNLAAIKRSADIGIGIAYEKYRLAAGKSRDGNSMLFRIIEEACNSRKVTEIAVNLPNQGNGLIESKTINE
jgi:hypothetical protein